MTPSSTSGEDGGGRVSGMVALFSFIHYVLRGCVLSLSLESDKNSWEVGILGEILERKVPYVCNENPNFFLYPRHHPDPHIDQKLLSR